MQPRVIALSVLAVVVPLVARPAPVRAQPSRNALADSARRLDSIATALGVWDRPVPENRRRAVRLWAEAATLYRRAGDRLREADMLTQAGRGGHGNPDTAATYLRTALQIARDAGDPAREGRALVWIGVMQANLGQYDSTLVLTREAARIARTVGERWGETWGWAFYWVGHAYLALGQLDSAEAYYREGVRAARATGARTPEAGSLGDIGNIHGVRGRYDSALVYYAAALDGFRAIGQRQFEGAWLLNIGSVHQNLGRSDSALIYYRRSLVVAQEVGHRGLEQGLAASIGNVLLASGYPDSAVMYLRRAVEMARELGDKHYEAAALGNLGEAQHANGQADSGLANLRAAIAMMRQLSLRYEEAGALATLGLIHASAGRVDSALAANYAGLRVAREGEGRVAESTLLQQLADLAAGGDGRRADLARAVAYYDSSAAVRATMAASAGGDQSRVSFAEKGGELFDRWALAWLARADEVGPDRSALAALAVAERGRAQALLELLRRGHNADSTAAAAFAGQQGRVVGADLVQEGSDLAAAVRAMGAPAIAYHATKDTLLTWLILPSGEVAVERQPITRDSVAQFVAAVRTHLGADEALGRSLRAIDPGDGPPASAADAPSSRRARSRVSATSASMFAASSAKLVPPSLLQRLPTGGELVIVPHGPLGLVPFAALPGGAAGSRADPLGGRFAIRYAPSLTALRVVSGRTGPAGATRGTGRASLTRKALVVGNPTMPRVRTPGGGSVRLPALPAAAREGRWVAQALGVTPLTGGAATEREVRARLADATVIHLATHGFAYSADARALDSFVAFAADSAPHGGASDGMLTVGEVIDEGPRLTAELVVLSACQTGLGNMRQAEGTVGLQRAFLAKGARSVLVSLWSVSDEATELLMRRFYTHWLRDADAPSKAEALRRSQADVRRTPGFADPRFWAAFQLVGAR